MEIFWAKIVIGIKAFNEYKINFWMMNLFDLVIFSTMLLFYNFIGSFLHEIIGWSFKDFILYFCLDLISWKVLWFFNLRNFNLRLLSGELNVHKVKPVNTFFLSAIELVNGDNIISLIYIGLFTIGLIIYDNYINFLFAIFMIFFSWFYFIVFSNFFNSIGFFVKKNKFFYDIPMTTNKLIRDFTPKMFDKFSFRSFLFILPISIHGFFVIEILKNRFNYFNEFLYVSIFSFLLMIIGTYFLWKIGLKKYEAFG